MTQEEIEMRLLRAAARGSQYEVEQAIADGADINARDYSGQTPLHLAFSRNHQALVDRLLQLGARDDLQDSDGLTAQSDSTHKGRCPVSNIMKPVCPNACRRCRSCISSNAEDALHSNFPRIVAEAMMQTKRMTAVSKPSVSLLFLDVVDFSDMRGSMDPVKVLSLLGRLFGAFDTLAAQHCVERVDIVDGCYIVAANFSSHQPADHAVRLARFALAAVRTAASTAVDTQTPRLGTVQLMAGMHCGAVCGSVVGAHGGRKHTLHGDAVNVASRMESHGAPGAVQCSAAAAALIEAQGGCSRGGLRLTQREEEVDVKGVGRMRTAWLSHSDEVLPNPGAGPCRPSPTCCWMSESLPAVPCPKSPGLPPVGCGNVCPPILIK